jgi:hypothetical protein
MSISSRIPLSLLASGLSASALSVQRPAGDGVCGSTEQKALDIICNSYTCKHGEKEESIWVGKLKGKP